MYLTEVVRVDRLKRLISCVSFSIDFLSFPSRRAQASSWAIISLRREKISVENAIACPPGLTLKNGKLKADAQIFTPNVDMDVEMSAEKYVVKVTSDVPKGRTILINLEKDTMAISKSEELLALYDGEEILMADDYADVLNPYDENAPEYLVLMGAERIQVLVSIPHFSSHTITVTRRTAAPTVLDRFNQIVWGIPIIGDIGKLLDAVVPGYSSVLLIVITVGFLIFIVVIWKRRKAFTHTSRNV